MIPEQTLLEFPLFGDNATKVEPDNNKKSNGWQQGDVVPSEWMNWEWYHASKGVADLNKGVASMEKEINAVLASFGITPDAAVYTQLLSALSKIYPQMCECSTPAATAAKFVTLQGNVLKAGNVYVITMTYGNTAANPTLSINSGTAYPICDANGTALASGAWEDGDIIKVLFTGTKYIMATQAVTDTVQSGNMKPVTSNAVKSTADQVVQNINNSRSYSTEEVNTGKTWIDGKPIYRKVTPVLLNSDLAPNITQNGNQYSFSGGFAINSETVVSVVGVELNAEDAWMTVINAGTGIYLVLASDTTIKYANGGIVCKELYAIIEYTKTTGA